MTASKKTSAIWGGRFDGGPSEVMDAINVSIDTDKRLYKQDLAGSRAHCRMLGKQGIIPQADADTILKGLDSIEAEMEAGTFPFRREYEDIHMNIEARLAELIGPIAGRLHTARSRNDQVVTSFRKWIFENADGVLNDIQNLIDILNTKSAAHKNTVMPGYTHTQVAQPVTLGLHLDAYAQMLKRDHARLTEALDRVGECPLGAAALAGTSYPIDRAMTAKELGFESVMQNPMDAVGARDFVLEILSVCAICGANLSRIAEELVLWSSTQFGFIRIADDFTSGSSIMPQKRNPDAAEIVRAKTGRLNGELMNMLTMMKALPLTYNKDMQEDKLAVFNAIDTLSLCLKATSGQIEGMKVNEDVMRSAAESGYSTATELADWLVQTHGIPFRECHHIVGHVVKLAEGKGLRLDQLSLADLQSVDVRITAEAQKSLSVEGALKRRKII